MVLQPKDPLFLQRSFTCKRCGTCCKVYYLVDFAKPEDWNRIFHRLIETGNNVVKVVTGTRGVVEYFELTSPDTDLVPDESPFFIALDGAAQCPFLAINLETCEYRCTIQEIKPQACRAFDNPMNCSDLQSQFGQQPLPDVCEDCLDFLREDDDVNDGGQISEIQIEKESSGEDSNPLCPPCERENSESAFECPYGHYGLRIAYETKWCLNHLDTYDYSTIVEEAEEWLQLHGILQFTGEDLMQQFCSERIKFLDFKAFSCDSGEKNVIFKKICTELRKINLVFQ